MKKSIFILIIIGILLTTQVVTTFAQSTSPSATPSTTTTPTSTDNSNSSSSDQSQQIQDLQNQISDYQNKISDLQSQENTLSSAIDILDSQTKLTELKIENAKQQIEALGHDVDITKKRIGDLEGDLTTTTKALLGSMREVYQVGQVPPWQILLTSDNISNFFTHFMYLKAIEAYNQRTVYAAEQTKEDYANEKAILTSKEDQQVVLQGQLQDYNNQLDTQKQAKQTLLSQTQGSEANYQHLLSQAQAQLNSFSNFTANQGGASLLSGQTVCDNWGCYYNQRDSQWGGNSLDGTEFSIASDGCLVTSLAMVYTHYGHKDVTPQSINSNSSNFASYYPAYLLYHVVANGTPSDRVSADIDSTLSSGNPVIVGVDAYGGTHFVVLTSGSNGNYTMNDPYLANGHALNFTDHYTMGSIFEIDRVNM